MTNYRSTSVTADSYVRANRVVVENPLGVLPSIMFIEEEVVTRGADTFKLPTSTLRAQMTEPATTFNILNPTDDSIIGSSTYQDVYVLLYSLHRHLAAIRDA